MMNNINQNTSRGMPSILGDVPPPFSVQPKLTGVSDDFNSLFDTWRGAPTPQTNTQIIKTIQPVIDTALSSYVGQSPTPAIRSKAKLMALKALQTFDPKMGNVRTHLLSQLQSLRRAAAQEQNIISIPEQVGLDYQKLVEAENELRDRLSRDPSDDEIADATGLSTRRIGKIRSFHQPLAEGSTIIDTGDDYADSGGIASSIPGQTSAQDAWLEFVYGDLSTTDKLIMDMTLGRNGRKKAGTAEIARKLNITSGAVSQRAAKIQTLLNQQKAF
jgi:DNA-directed RNA polymerase specialized sigma subunit